MHQSQVIKINPESPTKAWLNIRSWFSVRCLPLRPLSLHGSCNIWNAKKLKGGAEENMFRTARGGQLSHCLSRPKHVQLLVTVNEILLVASTCSFDSQRLTVCRHSVLLNERTWDAIEWSVAYSESFSWDQLHAGFTRFVKIANILFKKFTCFNWQRAGMVSCC